jgi:RecA/RadA recombinase
MDRILTGCKALDTLTDGGLPTGTITQIFGEKALGKSILSLQAGFATVAGGNSAIILDTEQSYLSYLVPYRKAGLEKRYGKAEVKELKLERVPKRQDKRNKQPLTRSELVTTLSSSLTKLGVAYTDRHMSAIADILSPEFQIELDGTEPSVMLLQMPDIIEMLALHGSETEKTVSEGGRVELRLRSTPTYQSALHQIIEQTHAKLLVYDSLSAPFKSTFPNTQDLPARSAGLAMLLSHAQRLCVEFGIAVVVTSHASIDPIKAWDRRPYGGITLGHEAKFSFELTKSSSKRNKEATAINPEDETEDGRAIWVQRHPAMADYSQMGFANIDDEGFR